MHCYYRADGRIIQSADKSNFANYQVYNIKNSNDSGKGVKYHSCQQLSYRLTQIEKKKT